MSNKQIIAVIAPVVLVAVMTPIFRWYVRLFPTNWRIGWFLGLATYWITWCGIFPWLLVGKSNILELIKPQRLTWEVVVLLLIPLVGAGLYRLIPGMEYEKPQVWVLAILVLTTFGNGFFEEVLWRGVYLDLFPDNFLFGMLWPSLWFALWHYAPVSIAPEGNLVGMIVGSGVMGFYLSFLARRTGTIWWTIVMHTLGGFIMIS
jgi:membrane protease YdiL (CAAX protease family)